MEDRFAGSTDVELSEEGGAQAKSLAARLVNLSLKAIYCSDMKRAIHTAEPIAAAHDLVPIQVPAFREVDHGRWEGRIHGVVEKEFASEYAHWSADPFTTAPPGGETGAAVLARSIPALRKVVEDHPDDTIGIVSHKATNRILLAFLLGIDLRTYRQRIAQDLACLNQVRFESWDERQVVVMNDTSHYRGI
jgi:probable phosphoglycerate mutase